MFKIIWERYMELSIRIGAYASALFFNAIIFSPFYGAMKSIVSLIFGIIGYELISFIVKKVYKPPSQKLQLSPEDREFRTVNEIRIFQIILFYVVYIIFSFVVIMLYSDNIAWYMWFGCLGGFLQAFHFVGLAILIAVFSRPSDYKLKPREISTRTGTIISVITMAPQLIYIVGTFVFFFFR